MKRSRHSIQTHGDDSARDCAGSLRRIAEALCAEKDPDEIGAFLSELLTPGELRDISLRWRLLEMLVQEVPQRAIASTLKVSLCKITRGSRILKDPSSRLRAAICESS